MASLKNYNPNNPALNNGHFMGFPFTEDEAGCILLPIPWDVTTSYSGGTSTAPENILNASYQLDLCDRYHPDIWKRGIFMAESDAEISTWCEKNRYHATQIMDVWESGNWDEQSGQWRDLLDQVNLASQSMNHRVYSLSRKYLNQNKKVLLIGGDHSAPYGYMQALAEREGELGILQIDAHCDLRRAYEGFVYSHATIMYNVVSDFPQVHKLIQVGIRDWCPEEEQRIRDSQGRITTWFMSDLNRSEFEGVSWADLCTDIVAGLPDRVYISLDIDGLDPVNCPHTGTPVPGGLDYQRLIYLLEVVHQSGRKIIGADLCEVAGEPHEWDGNVGARLAYKLALLLLDED